MAKRGQLLGFSVRIAQLVEHYSDTVDVEGSIPSTDTA